jgi:predicted HD superfamily hydrolase involved in NAD metabolism
MRWGIDTESARCAALLHDITKEMPNQLQLLHDYGILPAEWLKTVPSVHHAITGAALAKELGCKEEIISAIRWHTTGRAEMTGLEAIIYLADKTEPFRPLYSMLAEIRKMMYTDLNKALALTLRRIIQYNQERGVPVEQSSTEALDYIERKCIHGF